MSQKIALTEETLRHSYSRDYDVAKILLSPQLYDCELYLDEKTADNFQKNLIRFSGYDSRLCNAYTQQYDVILKNSKIIPLSEITPFVNDAKKYWEHPDQLYPIAMGLALHLDWVWGSKPFNLPHRNSRKVLADASGVDESDIHFKEKPPDFYNVLFDFKDAKEHLEQPLQKVLGKNISLSELLSDKSITETPKLTIPSPDDDVFKELSFELLISSSLEYFIITSAQFEVSEIGKQHERQEIDEFLKKLKDPETKFDDLYNNDIIKERNIFPINLLLLFRDIDDSANKKAYNIINSYFGWKDDIDSPAPSTTPNLNENLARLNRREMNNTNKFYGVSLQFLLDLTQLKEKWKDSWRKVRNTLKGGYEFQEYASEFLGFVFLSNIFSDSSLINIKDYLGIQFYQADNTRRADYFSRSKIRNFEKEFGWHFIEYKSTLSSKSDYAPFQKAIENIHNGKKSAENQITQTQTKFNQKGKNVTNAIIGSLEYYGGRHQKYEKLQYTHNYVLEVLSSKKK